MWQQVFDRLTQIRKLAGVSFWLGQDDTQIHAVILKREGVAVRNEQTITAASWEDLALELSKLNVPVVLQIDGRAVLHKITEKQSEVGAQDLLNSIIPNARAAEFHLQRYDTTENRYVSIIRKESLDDILTLFRQKKIEVIQVFLGPFISASLQFASEHPLKSINVAGWKLELNDTTVANLAPERQQTQAPLLLKDGEKLEPPFFLPYAAGISIFINGYEQQFAFLSDSFKGLRNNWQHKIFFQQSLKFILAFLFLLLLGNGLLFMQATKRNDELSIQADRHRKMLQRLETLREDVGRKRKFITQTAWGDVGRTAFYADRLAASLPDNVWLTEINIHPLDEKILKDERKQIFTGKLLWVKGRAGNSLLVNDWIKKLSTTDWVENVIDQEYEYSSQDQSGKFFFKVLLK